MKNSQTLKRRILIVDDHQIYLDGLEMLIQQHLAAVEIFKASDIEHVKNLVQEHGFFDLILLDLQLVGETGFDVCQMPELSQQPIAILSASEQPKDLAQAKALGLLGYINKACDNQVLLNTIEQLLEGDRVYPEHTKSVFNLTPRQLDVLRLLSEGYPNKVICRELNLSEATVKTHLRALYNILDVHTRLQCVNTAREHNLI
ncbi:MAG: response regulator transcription factor [Gammaproteobacteria bacterium]|nr:response regulator transcription factor [Gammaproteobacteria bacterium]